MPFRPDQKAIKVLPEAEWKTPGPARYSNDGGFTLTNYRPGQVYVVQDYVAWGMERRGWAKIISEAEADIETKLTKDIKTTETQDTVDTEISLSDLRKAKEPKP